MEISKEKAYVSYLETVIGKITIVSFAGKLCMIEFENNKDALTSIEQRLKKFTSSVQIEESNIEPVIVETKRQLTEYFSGERRSFDLPLLTIGTPFQKSVWGKLKQIPYGVTKTYKDIAIEVGNEKAVRAVGGANNKNAIPIVIPCHRVIGTNSKLTGFAGGLDVKEKLLEIEKITLPN
jgi:methylated-DNA-[protein]-cysteine S-methyltransferase